MALVCTLGVEQVTMVHTQAGPAAALLDRWTDRCGDWAAQGGLLPGSSSRSHSPPCSHSIPLSQGTGTAWLSFLTMPSDLEGGKPLLVSMLASKRDGLGRQTSAQPPATCIPRLWQQPSCSARTLHSSPCQGSTKPRPEMMPSPSPAKSPKALFCRKIYRKMGRDKASCSSF